MRIKKTVQSQQTASISILVVVHDRLSVLAKLLWDLNTHPLLHPNISSECTSCQALLATPTPWVTFSSFFVSSGLLCNSHPRDIILFPTAVKACGNTAYHWIQVANDISACNYLEIKVKNFFLIFSIVFKYAIASHKI